MSNNFIIEWSGRAFDYSEDEISAIVDAMKHADPLTQGRFLNQFQIDFSEYNRTPNSFAMSNCTNALEIAALLIGLKKHDEVIIPAHTFCASAIPFGRTGAKIVWGNIDPDTRVISTESIEENITSHTRAIVVVHLYGLMADMNPIMDIAADGGYLVVETCAQAIGAEYKGKKAGNHW